MIKYDNYKDSEIEWLGQIPEHWKIRRIKNIGSVNGRVGWKALKANEYVDQGYFFLSTPNIKNVNIDFVNVNYITAFRYYESPEIMLKEGDVLLVKDGSTLGIVNVIRSLPAAGTVNSSIAVLRIKRTNSIFIYYSLLSSYIQNIIQLKKDGMGVPHLFQRDINQFNILIPPLPEQKAIAQYLDDKTQAIDKKVTLLKQKISYYKELRKSIINKAVTKGLTPGVEMKESEIGIKIPSTWNQFRLKDIGILYSGLSGKSGDDFNQDDNENNKSFIPFTNILANTYISDENIGNVVVFPSEKQNKVKVNDLFFLMSSEGYEDIGKSALLDHHLEETYLNSFCKGFRITNKSCSPAFLNYLLQSRSYRQLLSIEGKGFTRINLKMEKVSDFCVYLPNQKAEQIAIANYLDEKTTQIDSIISNIEQQIEKLKELRKTLINDVVTGKIKVA